MKRITIDKDKCSGCRCCELVCSYRENSRFNPRESKIRVLKYDESGIDEPVVCHQCVLCPSADACPTQAFQRGKDGIVRIEDKACTACYACVNACPHQAVFRPPTQSPPLVCDLCDGKPLCVKKCPTHALTCSTMESLLSCTHTVEGEATK